MSELVVLVGLPGAGKTTFARSYAEIRPRVVVVSTDEIRARCPALPPWAVFKSFLAAVSWHLDRGVEVVADSTGLDRRIRDELRELAREREARCTACVFTDTEGALERNAERPRPVPCERKRRNFERTLRSIDREGFDGVHRF